jgi:hypothetical protein
LVDGEAGEGTGCNGSGGLGYGGSLGDGGAGGGSSFGCNMRFTICLVHSHKEKMAHKALLKFGVSFRDMLKEALTVDKNTGAIGATLEALPFDIFWRTLAIVEYSAPDQQEPVSPNGKKGKTENKALQQAHAELQNFLVSVLSQIATSIKKKAGGLEEIQPLINTVNSFVSCLCLIVCVSEYLFGFAL